MRFGTNSPNIRVKYAGINVVVVIDNVLKISLGIKVICNASIINISTKTICVKVLPKN